MNLLNFTKLISRFYKIIIAVPIILAILVFLLTRKEVHMYSSGMTIYTGIASGYTIQSLENYKVDMFNTNNQFDNLINILKSRDTKEEVALQLLAMQLILKEPNKEIILKPAFDELNSNIPNEIKKIIVPNSAPQTYEQLVKFKTADNLNFIYKLLNSNHKYYSINTLSRIASKRIGNSDLVEIAYSSDDPAICYQTLITLSTVFIKNYKQIRQVQTDAIVKYFEQQLTAVALKLKNAEDKLLEFNQDNKIINYYEQTRYIAEQKEYLETEFLHEKMNFSASQAATKTLESKIGAREKIFWKNDAIINLRNDLYNLNLQYIGFKPLANTNKDIHELTKPQLQLLIDSVKAKLQNKITEVFELNNSKEGIESERIINQWLTSVIANEESRAKLEVYDQRRNEFKNIYSEMAPLGATIKRIEREIEINEQQYLSVLHSLNMAKLKMQDIELSSNIKVLDPPFYPVNSEPSKRKLIIVVAFMGGLMLMISIIFFLEYTDKTIRTPENAAKLTGLRVIGLYPRILKKLPWTSNLAKKLSTIMAHMVSNYRTDKNIKIGVLSTTDHEGKTTIIDGVVEELLLLGYKAIKITIESSDLRAGSNKVKEKLNRTDDFLFAEMPSIIYTPISANVLKDFDVFIMICRANRVWSPSDTRALEVFQSTAGKKPYLILNGVEPDAVESYIGEIPKTRSKIRIWIKKILTFSFLNKNSI